MKALSRAQASSCEKAKGGRCRCRCGGALHGAGRTSDTATLPIADAHRTDLTDRDRLELAAVWALEAAEAELARCGCADPATPAAAPMAGASGEQLRLFPPAQRQIAHAAPAALPRSRTRTDDRRLAKVRALRRQLGASKEIHAHRNEGI